MPICVELLALQRALSNPALSGGQGGTLEKAISRLGQILGGRRIWVLLPVEAVEGAVFLPGCGAEALDAGLAGLGGDQAEGRGGLVRIDSASRGPAPLRQFLRGQGVASALIAPIGGGTGGLLCIEEEGASTLDPLRSGALIAEFALGLAQYCRPAPPQPHSDLADVLDAIPDATLVFAADGLLLTANAAFASGFPQLSLRPGLSLSEVLAALRPATGWSDGSEPRQDGGRQSGEVTLADGRMIRWIARPYRAGGLTLVLRGHCQVG